MPPPETASSRRRLPDGLHWLLLAVIVAVGAWLRFSHFDLLEFQGDEAYAAQLALQFLKHGQLPTAGLMSSVGVTNPPLFIYLLIPMFAISSNPVVVSCFIAALSLAAVVVCWHIGRKYYGPIAGLTAAAMFAVSPWAVIYSRKIWAQDFVPIFSTGAMWAVHALCIGKKPKAIFWVVLLPVCVVQIHFSGLALTAAVLAIVLWLRPMIDWRWAAAGLLVSLMPMLPYLYLQTQTGWRDFKQASKTVGGGQQWEQLQGRTVNPLTGYREPSRAQGAYALAIMNNGRIEDVLGIAAAPEFDLGQVWTHKGDGQRPYFSQSQTLGDWLLVVQRIGCVVALAWLAIIAVKAVRWPRVEETSGRAAWILLLWAVVPVVVFTVAGLWTYLTYFAILFPVHFLVCGAAGEMIGRRLKPAATAAIVAVVVAGNLVYMLDYYRFVGKYGGAQGTAGTGLGYKQAAARFLAEQGGVRLQSECETQLALAMSRTQDGRARLAQQLGQPQLLELNHGGQAELPQQEWPLLVTQAKTGAGELPKDTTVILVDGNREALQPQQWQQLSQYWQTNFGPVRIVYVKR